MARSTKFKIKVPKSLRQKKLCTIFKELNRLQKTSSDDQLYPIPATYGSVGFRFTSYKKEELLKYYGAYTKKEEAELKEMIEIEELEEYDVLEIDELEGVIERQALFKMASEHPEVIAGGYYDGVFAVPLFDAEVGSVIEELFDVGVPSDLDETINSLKSQLEKLERLNTFVKPVPSPFVEVELHWDTHLHVWNPEEEDWNDCWGYWGILTGLFDPNETIEDIEAGIDTAITPIKKDLAKGSSDIVLNF